MRSEPGTRERELEARLLIHGTLVVGEHLTFEEALRLEQLGIGRRRGDVVSYTSAYEISPM